MQSPKRGLGFFGRELPKRLDGRLMFFFLCQAFLSFAQKERNAVVRENLNIKKMEVKNMRYVEFGAEKNQASEIIIGLMRILPR